MRPMVYIFSALLWVLAFSTLSLAEQFKLFVPDFSVTGAVNKEEMAVSLRVLLTSRLNPDLVQLVKTQGSAELVVAGSYVVFGKMFSLDAQISGVASEKLQKVFEQGEGQDDVIPVLGRLAQKVNKELEKISLARASSPSAPSTSVTAKQVSIDRTLPQSWISHPLEGALTGIALGRTLANGDREIFVAGEQVIRYYRQGKEFKLVSEVVFPGAAKILTIDTADLDGDGIPEIYVTVMDRENLVSQVFLPKEAGLEKITDGLPLFLRGIGTDLKNRKILAQKIGAHGNFYGGILELEKSGNRFESKKNETLPEYASIFNSNSFMDASGKRFLLTINEDGIIVVRAPDGTVAWKSSENYGGSEQYFKQEVIGGKHSADDQYRWTFIEQRILITAEGDILIPQNKGSYNAGNYRSYNKHALHALRWNGAVLEDSWRTNNNPTYLADFAYDSSTRELILLKVSQKEGIWGKGRSVITIHNVE